MSKRLSAKELAGNIEESRELALAIKDSAQAATAIIDLLYTEAMNFCKPSARSLVKRHLDQANKHIADIYSTADDIRWMPTERDETEDAGQ